VKIHVVDTTGFCTDSKYRDCGDHFNVVGLKKWLIQINVKVSVSPFILHLSSICSPRKLIPAIKLVKLLAFPDSISTVPEVGFETVPVQITVKLEDLSQIF